MNKSDFIDECCRWIKWASNDKEIQEMLFTKVEGIEQVKTLAMIFFSYFEYRKAHPISGAAVSLEHAVKATKE